MAWYEGSWGYHFYALNAHLQLAEMALRAGIDLYAERALRKMFEAPLKIALPDKTLPAFNDGATVSIPSYGRLYEIAYRRYSDSIFATVLGYHPRGRQALFWGSEILPQTSPHPLSSAVFENSGNAVLRATGSDHTVILKFGPHGGGHGHYDKLSFISFARGGIMAVDPGNQSYAAATYNTWDKVTAAHNTVVVDERTQGEAAGHLLAFAALPDVSGVRADGGLAYKNVALDRSLILTSEYAIDSFLARSVDGAEHRFDWIYHNFGNVSSTLPLKSYTEFPATNGYQHLSQPRAAVTGDAWIVDFERPLSRLCLRMLGAPDTTVVLGNGLGPDRSKPVPFVMARRRGVVAQFTAAFEPYGETPAITSFYGPVDGWFKVTSTNFDDRISFDAAGVLRYIRYVNGAIRRLGIVGGTVLKDNGRVLLQLDRAVSVQVDFTVDKVHVFAAELRTGKLRLFAPDSQPVLLNGRPIDFQRDGAYVIIDLWGNTRIFSSCPKF